MKQQLLHNWDEFLVSGHRNGNAVGATHADYNVIIGSFQSKDQLTVGLTRFCGSKAEFVQNSAIMLVR